MPTVHGAPLSPFVRKVRVALHEKGIQYDLVPVIPFPPANDDPAFRRISPLGKIPAYTDGDFAISDSSVILNYLESNDPALLPEDAQQRARALWIEEYADSELANNVGPVFFQRFVAPKVLQQESDQTVIDAALNEGLPPVFDYLEEQLGDGEYFAAGRFTVADVAVGAMLRQLQLGGESVDTGRWPQLTAFAERIFSRPSFKTAAEAENQMLRGM